MYIEQEVNIYQPAAISNEFKSQDTKIEAINGKIAVLMTDTEMQELEDSSATMYSRLAQAEFDIDSLDLQFADTQTRFNAIDGRFNSVDTRFTEYSASIDGLSADISNVSRDLSDNYSTTTAMNAAIQASVDGLSSTVSSTYVTNDVAAATYATQTALANASDVLETYADTAMGTAISTATANASDLANAALNSSKAYTDGQLTSYSTTSQMQSAIDQATDSITASVSSRYTTKAEFSELTIGTTNLLRNTKTLAGASASSYGTIENDYDDFAVFSSTNQSSIRSVGVQILPFQNYNDIVRNKTLTLSFMMRSDYASEINADSSQGLYFSAQLKINGTTRGTKKNFRSVPLTTEWSKFTYTFVWNDSFVNVPSGTVFDENVQFALTIGIDTKYAVHLKMFKLEEGEKASTWSPSPFDDETAISSLASRVSAAELKITDSAITSTVTSSSAWDGLVDRIDSTQTSITNLDTRLTTAESSITQNANEISTRVSELSDTVDENSTSISGLTTRMTSAESSITQNADQIATRVAKDGVISAINQSSEQITIDASKINLTGFVTFTNLATDGQTTINGSNIKTGSLDVGGSGRIGSIKLYNGNNVIGTFDQNGVNVLNGTFTSRYASGSWDISATLSNACLNFHNDTGDSRLNSDAIIGFKDGGGYSTQFTISNRWNPIRFYGSEFQFNIAPKGSTSAYGNRVFRILSDGIYFGDNRVYPPI